MHACPSHDCWIDAATGSAACMQPSAAGVKPFRTCRAAVDCSGATYCATWGDSFTMKLGSPTCADNVCDWATQAQQSCSGGQLCWPAACAMVFHRHDDGRVPLGFLVPPAASRCVWHHHQEEAGPAVPRRAAPAARLRIDGLGSRTPARETACRARDNHWIAATGRVAVDGQRRVRLDDVLEERDLPDERGPAGPLTARRVPLTRGRSPRTSALRSDTSCRHRTPGATIRSA